MIRSKIFRTFALTTAFALFNATIPLGAVAAMGRPIREKVGAVLAARAAAEKAKAVSRALTPKEQNEMQGRSGTCPYLAGQNKWDLTHDGIDLMSGNYTSSVNDMSFDGGYGIPVNITRSYSSNDASEEPFGYGWSLSADVRSTTGGLFKSKSAPIRSVPVNYKERNTAEADPNVATQPAAAVTATDASGRSETIQKDIDGLLTTPPWDSNVSNPTYSFVTFGGSVYQVQSGNVTTTLDGTAYTYQAEGSYPGGTVPYNNPTATPQPASVLKVTQVVDRQGNVTTYHYNTSVNVSFNKIDGVTQEHPLTSVSMPNGHVITLTWGNGTSAPTNRIVAVSDGTRTINYGYTTIGGQSMLTSVTTAAGYTTQYGYGTAEVATGWTGPIATNLLTAIRNPQSLTTTMTYQMLDQNVCPYMVTVPAPVCQRVIQPNGIEFYFSDGNLGSPLPDGDFPGQYMIGGTQAWLESMGSAAVNGNIVLSFGSFLGTASGPDFTVAEQDLMMANPSSIITSCPGTVSTYETSSENLIDQTAYTYAYTAGHNPELHVGGGANFAPDPTLNRNLIVSSGVGDLTHTVEEVTAYNFGGNPLSKTDTEGYYAGSAFNLIGGAFTQTRQATTSFAYWDASKYYQQKATKDQAGRYSYTDYYPSTAAAGSRGQRYQEFDQAHAGFFLNTGITPPSYALPGDYWKYQLTPTSGQYSGQFVYDSVGRRTDVYKLQKTTPSWSYVRANTTYGGNGAPTWGQAAQAIEDYGGINRISQTTAYTSWGKPSAVQDAAGHKFVTTFDLDGNVQAVNRTDVIPNVTVASYSYGSSGIGNGLPVSITDGLSGVIDTVTYQPSGPGIGQIASTSETNGTTLSSVAYAYNSTGDRWKTTYTTPNGVTTWEYDDWQSVGETSKSKRMFETLTRLTSGVLTPEQFQYGFNSAGAIRVAAFAQTPKVGFTPTAGNPWYDATNQASTRARAYYGYDSGGRTAGVTHWWDTWGGSAFSSAPIIDNECAYEENTGLNRGLKTSSSFYTGSGSGWILNHAESYGYDANLDYLASANYGDGLPNATPSWTYDAAENRNDVVPDNLNRPSTINGIPSSSDILGNRLTLGSQSFGWDCLNRMTSYDSSSAYVYRGDGMRVSKTVSGLTTKYFYDGQMGIEDQTAPATLTDYGIGPRGVDYISRSASGVTTVGFPVYDAHGNMTACLFRSGSSYTIGNQRSYDAWGVIRSGSLTGDPSGRYCASLGHKQDDESHLTYMRARYYDGQSGRFLSQDTRLQGLNWFSYCNSDPVNKLDQTGGGYFEGSFWWQTAANATMAVGFTLVGFAVSMLCLALNPGQLIAAYWTVVLAVFVMGAALIMTTESIANDLAFSTAAALIGVLFTLAENCDLLGMTTATAIGEKSSAGPAVGALFAYSLTVMSYILSADISTED